MTSLARRLSRIEPFDLIVMDEAHHAVAGSWQEVTDAMPSAFVLGVTATPERLDGRGLGDVFEHMVLGPTTAELTEAGFLVPSTVYAPPESVDLSSLRSRAGDFATEGLSGVMSDATLVATRSSIMPASVAACLPWRSASTLLIRKSWPRASGRRASGRLMSTARPTGTSGGR